MMRNLYVFVIALIFFSTGLFAAEVTKVKGTNALIDLKGDTAAPGDAFFSISSDGKRRGILQITKVKGDKAIGKITKGKVDVGMTLEHKAGGGGAAAPTQAKHKKGGKSSDGGGGTSRSYWGGLVGYSRDTMSVQVNSFTNPGTVVGTAALSGSAFSAMAMFDYELFPQIWFRGLGGLEGFSVSGSSICGAGNAQACNASIYYISMDFLGRYVFSTGDIRPWLGGGLALMFPASKSATALDSASISNTSVIQFGGGVDWFVSPTMYIPISVEYGMLPKSNEVDATWIELRVGLAIPF
jgi:hypothetical protein